MWRDVQLRGQGPDQRLDDLLEAETVEVAVEHFFRFLDRSYFRPPISHQRDEHEDFFVGYRYPYAIISARKHLLDTLHATTMRPD